MPSDKWLAENTFILLLPFTFVISQTYCQNYANRDPLQSGVRIEAEEEYEDLSSEDYNWNLVEPQVWRWNVEDFPHPRTTPKFCNRVKPSSVCDPDRVLTKEQADSLDASIQKILNESPCICESCPKDHKRGVQLGIAILENTFQPYNEHPSKVIRSFSRNLRAKWRLGECDNDILIVVATNDRQSYTDIGETTSSFITLKETYRIFLENRAHFTAGRYYEGLQAMLKAYHEVTRVMASSTRKESKANVGFIAGLVVGIALLLGGIIVVTALLVHRFRYKKQSAESNNSCTEDVSSSWIRKESFKRALPSLFSYAPPNSGTTEYRPCKTEDEAPAEKKVEEEEVLNLEIPHESQETDVNISPEDNQDVKQEENTKTKILQTFARKKEYEGDVTDL